MTDAITTTENPPPCEACGETLVNVIQVPPQSDKAFLECRNSDCAQNGVRIDWEPKAE